jgi:hypothetical protein
MPKCREKVTPASPFLSFSQQRQSGIGISASGSVGHWSRISLALVSYGDNRSWKTIGFLMVQNMVFRQGWR